MIQLRPTPTTSATLATAAWPGPPVWSSFLCWCSGPSFDRNMMLVSKGSGSVDNEISSDPPPAASAPIQPPANRQIEVNSHEALVTPLIRTIAASGSPRDGFTSAWD